MPRNNKFSELVLIKKVCIYYYNFPYRLGINYNDIHEDIANTEYIFNTINDIKYILNQPDINIIGIEFNIGYKNHIITPIFHVNNKDYHKPFSVYYCSYTSTCICDSSSDSTIASDSEIIVCNCYDIPHEIISNIYTFVFSKILKHIKN